VGHLDRAKRALAAGKKAASSTPAPIPTCEISEISEESPPATPGRPLPGRRPDLYECGEDPFPDVEEL
jgi:hypothetical protein